MKVRPDICTHVNRRVITAPHSLSELLLSVVALVPSWSSSLSGQLLSTTLLPAGHGIPMAGLSFSVAMTSPEEHPFTSALEQQLSPSLFTLESVGDMALNALHTSLTTQHTLSSARYSSGLVGSASTEALLSLPTCVLSKLAL